jgi:hypothetical protein
MITGQTEKLAGWGMADFCTALAYHPRDAAEVAEAVADAARRDLTIVHRGAGISYGDASLNEGGAVIHTSALDRILHFDPVKGTVRAEAGVSIAGVWRYVLSSGWWPPIVPGTMHVTLGGAAAMNIHGKNGFKSGCFGDHVLALTLLDSSGEVRELTRAAHSNRLKEIIGAQGLNGTILDVTLQLKKVSSGMLEVTPIPTGSLEENLEKLDVIARAHDYAVGWIDAFASGRSTGRGLLHAASHPAPDHRASGKHTDVGSQELPSAIFGLLPSRHVWRFARPFVHGPGMRAINFAKSLMGQLGGTRPFLQPHAAFHFLLDYVPNWKYVYRPGGLLQYQFFAPADAALPMFREALRMQQRAGMPSYLAVLKRHRRDEFAASYSVDGYSLAMDFPRNRRSDPALLAMLREFDMLQRSMGGHVYAAKDSVSHGVLPCVRDPRFSSNLVRRWEAAQ